MEETRMPRQRKRQVAVELDDRQWGVLLQLCGLYDMKRPELFRFLLRVAERHAGGSPLALPEMRAETAEEYAARRLPDGPYSPEDLEALAAIELGFIGKAANQPLSRAHVDAWCEQREIYKTPRSLLRSRRRQRVA
jgi:hypothetical protein